jgi:hypothetical protein
MVLGRRQFQSGNVGQRAPFLARLDARARSRTDAAWLTSVRRHGLWRMTSLAPRWRGYAAAGFALRRKVGVSATAERSAKATKT